ncbi:putative esterase [Arcticibacter tournemirensis]|uniref:Alpha/beta hydrolase n=1 Tax=Arcticibacter tournemirensis TaxID=699437 RepID=A0A5M9GME8_9SPHI|nr:alpha/beta hydrolase-fold protein [Arcticibacter tournemirensis]KAA8473974.1 alpha/beta hydrolase [Arcticibacter tournemirensis]TQM49922.1 putative esterase [Arcticibacter tournemirensis]
MIIKLRVCRLFSCLLLFFVSGAVSGQSAYQFKEGYILKKVHRYGREALYSDPLAWQLYNGSLKTPVDGAVFGSDSQGTELKWEKAVPDSSGKFGGRGYWGNGYLYLSYSSDESRTALLNIQGNSAVYVNGILHFGDPYQSGWMYIPVQLKKGLNEFYVRGQYSSARLIFPAKAVTLNTEDSTLPSIIAGADNSGLKAAVVVINSGNIEQKGLSIRSTVGGKEMITKIPSVPALATRKVMFNVNAGNVTSAGKVNCRIELIENGKTVDENKVELECVNATDKYMNTFVSAIDGSLQYFAVSPQTGGSVKGASLFFSVHGAGVEAIGQAKAYQAKDWGTLVAPTNRRPRGFNWEDWGRLDALEVLNIARNKFNPDPDRIYLTGHSMGGHGTWFLGATYPGNWASIAPCAGYPTLKGYGSADGLIPDKGASPAEQMLLRSSNQSDVPALATNYKPFGVYINHGDADPVVSVEYARQMKKVLADFHPDFSYYEYPGGSHWYGSESVDWKPLFDFFKWHKRLADTAVNVVDFKTASPGISSTYRWVSILQQTHPLEYSRVILQRDKAAGTISGTTQNVKTLKFLLSDFGAGKNITILLDSLNALSYTTKGNSDSIFLSKRDKEWALTSAPSADQKGPHRYGTFKEPFGKRMIFVYGTKGNKEENEWSLNKARYDAEAWYYRGNGAVDIIPDKEYSENRYTGRNVIIYGNASTNSVYNKLLKGCPIQVSRNLVKVGGKEWKGDDLGAYYIWPIKSTGSNSVAVVAGSGLKGMKAAEANQYFAGASGFPDFMIFGIDMLQSGSSAVKCTGFYDNDWKIGKEVVFAP